MSVTMFDIIEHLVPNAEFTMNGDTYADIEWHDTTKTKPTEAEIENARTAAQAALDLDLLRGERNKKLSETDWYANSDVTMSAAMTTYRQALRDITDTYSDLDTVVWPTKP